jgi:urease accessory protein
VTLELLHLCDSLFPLGAFSYSDGLETAAAQGAVHDRDSLREWLDAVLDESFGRFEGPVAWQARTLIENARWDDIVQLDAEAIALRPSSSGRRATGAMGQRLLATWRALHPDLRLDELHRLAERRAIAPTLPIAFAAACLCAGVDRHAALEALAYTRLASTVSAAMRVAPLGQNAAHALLSEILARVPEVVRDIAARGAPPESFAIQMDLAAMEQQYLHSRLFRS